MNKKLDIIDLGLKVGVGILTVLSGIIATKKTEQRIEETTNKYLDEHFEKDKDL